MHYLSIKSINSHFKTREKKRLAIMLKFTFSGFTFTLLFLVISTTAQSPAVLDADGRPLRTGVKYYIHPAATDIAGAITLVNRTNSCPQFVGQVPLARFVPPGLPVTLTPQVAGRGDVVREDTDYSFVFSEGSACGRSVAWQLGQMDEESKGTWIVGGEKPVQGSPDWKYLNRYFRIVKNEAGLYTFEWCPGCLAQNCPKPRCGPLGISVQNGTRRFLVLYAAPFPFVFRRA